MSEGVNYWLLITSRGYWKVLKKKQLWGFSDNKPKVKAIKSGDKGVVYLTADGGKYDSAIGGFIEFIGDTWEIEKKITFFDKIYPIRIKVKLLQIKDPPQSFRPFIGRVSFTNKGRYWATPLQGQPIKTMSVEDYNLLLSES